MVDARQAIVDGEVIALDDARGARLRPAPGADQGPGPRGRHDPFVYEVFDLLHLDGRSLLDEPLEERRRLLARSCGPIRGSGSASTSRARASRSSRRRRRAASRGSWPRIAARRTCPGKRAMTWQKVKIRPEQELVVGGWTRGTGKAIDLGALLVGRVRGRRAAVRRQGRRGVHERQPGRAARRGRAARGRRVAVRDAASAAGRAGRPLARPELVIRAEFAGWTGDGLVRQAAYKGFDLGKNPRAVRRERPTT